MKDARPTPAELRKMANDALAYLCSPAGQMKLRERNEDADRLVEQFRKMRRIPHELLHRPFDI
jgi:hypothetical protein